ncbi:MAG: YHS domain-containing protein [Flavobacterium sp.]|nr:YHS domain-containing protein [Flavobacterium sp.]
MLSPNQLSGRNHSNANTINNSESNFDVVCGNTVSLQQPFYSTQYNNITYYFDTEECLNKFQQSPDSYLSKTSNNQKNNSLLYWGLGAATMGVMMFLMIN